MSLFPTLPDLVVQTIGSPDDVRSWSLSRKLAQTLRLYLHLTPLLKCVALR